MYVIIYIENEKGNDDKMRSGTTQLIFLRDNINPSFYFTEILKANTNIVCHALQNAGCYSTGIKPNGDFTIEIEEERPFWNGWYDENIAQWFKTGQPRNYCQIDDEDFEDSLKKIENLGIRYQPIHDTISGGKVIGFVTEPIPTSIADFI